MYKSFTAKNFRGFEDLRLDDLARVNLIAGKNNTGKTALLEALWIHSGAYNPSLALRVNNFRGIESFKLGLGRWYDAPWDSVFNKFDTTNVIDLESETHDDTRQHIRLTDVRDPVELIKIVPFSETETNGLGEASPLTSPIRVLRLEYQDQAENHHKAHLIFDHQGLRSQPTPAPSFQSIFLTTRGRTPLEEEIARFTTLRKNGKLDILLDALRIVEPKLKSIELLEYSGHTIIHGHGTTDIPIPIIFMGDGVARLASLILAIGNAPDGVVLVDEIENGLHYSVLKDVWKAIGAAARAFNTQVFATTHSWECLVAAHRAFSEGQEYDFRLHRLERDKAGKIRAVTFDQEMLDGAIEMGFEVR